MPAQFRLRQNIPNPFGTGTIIGFDLPERSRVRLTVYDIVGRVVDVLVDDTVGAGFHAVAWEPAEGKGLSAGVYFYIVTAVGLDTNQHFSQERKMILAR
jgi:hypothetical protein